MTEMVGGAFIARVKLMSDFIPPALVAEIVIVVTPLIAGMGVTCTVRVAPIPARTTLAAGANV